ncbi:MAG: restriction endonuclease [Chloroflexota bacterium]|nr:restriction endonuclease [Chloroflexota bacterium]
MAKLKDANPKNVSGGYDRLFGIPELGLLMSKVQSTVISSGSELERLITSMVETVDNLDTFLHQDVMPEGVFLATKQQIKKSKTLKYKGAEPDFMVFKRREGKQRCHIIELKDGHVFDTKKAAAEHTALHTFIERNALHLPFMISTHFCAFNQDDKTVIYDGFKRKIELSETMTGREFCELLELDYDEIVATRSADRPANVRYFVSELLRIPQIRNLVQELLNRH